MKKISVLALFLLFLITNLANVQAADIKYQPTTQFFVNDFADILSAETEQQIFNMGVAIQQNTTAQLVIVTVPNMEGNYIEAYANTFFKKWKIGLSGKNNGILLIYAQEENKIRIEVGYGLEGAINDAKAGRILDKYSVIPLKEKNYDSAILDAAKQLQGEIYTEYNIDNTIENPNFVPIDPVIKINPIYIVIGIIIFIILAIVTKGGIFEVLFWLFMLFGRGGGGRRRFRWRWRRLWRWRCF